MNNDRLNFRIRLAAALVAFACFAPIDAVRAHEPVKIPVIFDNADAVVLRWEQTWDKADDGALTRHEIKHVLVRSDRTYHDLADPRLTFNQDYQTVELIRCSVVCSDHRIVDIPDYGKNFVAPNATGGWPDFGDVRQMVCSFSGVEIGAVLEFEWKITTKPGLQKFVELECPMYDQFPVLLRRVQFPNGKRYEMRDIPAIPHEANAIPWRDAGGYVWYTDCPDERTWARSVLGAVEAAAQPSKAVAELAKEWASDQAGAIAQAEAIRAKLNSRLSIINAPLECVSDKLRSADRVMATHYGRPAEAAALMLTAFRAAGLDAAPFFVISDEDAGWVRSAIAHYGVCLQTEGGPTYWDLTKGRVRNPGVWAGQRRYDAAFVNGAIDEPARFAVPAANDLQITGHVKLDDKAAWTAELEIIAKGLFVPQSSLLEAKQQKAAVNAVLSSTLPKAKLKEFAVTQLSDDSFVVSVKAESSEALTELAGRAVLELPQTGPWAQTFQIPLNRKGRETTLRIAGPFVERIALDVELPKGWSLVGFPSELNERPVEGVRVHGLVKSENNRVMIRRTLEVGTRDITSAQFDAVREAINHRQARTMRTLLLQKPEKDSANDA